MYDEPVARACFTVRDHGAHFGFHLLEGLVFPLPHEADAGQGPRVAFSSRSSRRSADCLCFHAMMAPLLHVALIAGS